MFVILLFMLMGILSGFLLRRHKITFINRIIVTLIWLLLFLLGMEVGSNELVIAKFGTLGFEAIIIAAAATLGSIIGARWLLPPKVKNVEKSLDIKATKISNVNRIRNIWKALQGSFVILAFFVGGLLLGLFHVFELKSINENLSLYVLEALMFSVGFSIGQQPDTIKQFRRIHSKVLLLPVMTIFGTWAGAMLVVIFSRHSISDILAVASGFGYYSLSGILMTEYRGAELGTLALLTNIAREIMALLFAPLMAKYFGKLAPIAAGGASTMDTTFPIIIQTSGKEFSVVAIYHGFVVDLSVPFLVTLWCGVNF